MIVSQWLIRMGLDVRLTDLYLFKEALNNSSLNSQSTKNEKCDFRFSHNPVDFSVLTVFSGMPQPQQVNHRTKDFVTHLVLANQNPPYLAWLELK